MDNEKPKRIRTAHIAFVQKTMDGATGILVKPITYKIHQGKTYGIEIYREQKPGNYPKTGWNNSGKHYAESAIMQFSLYGSLWVQWCRKRLGCRILDLVDTQKFFINPRPPHSYLFLVLWFVFFRQLIALTFASNVSWKFEFVFVLDFQSLINRLCAKFHVAIFLHHVVCITFSNRAQHIFHSD